MVIAKLEVLNQFWILVELAYYESLLLARAFHSKAHNLLPVHLSATVVAANANAVKEVEHSSDSASPMMPNFVTTRQYL